jgi:hypothetical protein
MRYQMMIGDEAFQLLHHIIDIRGLGQHLVGNAGVILDEVGYPHFGVHEALESVHDLVVDNKDGSNFYSAVTVISLLRGDFRSF